MVERHSAAIGRIGVLAAGVVAAVAFAPIAVSAPPSPIAQQPSPSCDPNYTGACVPIDSDVDCAGGSGNGPSYVSGPVTVVGTDIYDLDRDGNGTGCE
jgi:hypothetical protein